MWGNISNKRKDGKMFKLVSDYKPTGDQPKAIEYLSKEIQNTFRIQANWWPTKGDKWISKRTKRGQEIPDTSRSYRLW